MATATVSATGISVLYDPRDPLPDTDIVFVHGLQGHAQKTWTYRMPVNQETPLSSLKKKFLRFRSEAPSHSLQPPISHPQAVFWPRDLLPRECPNARILTFGYDSRVTQKYDAVNQGNIFTHAKDLLYSIDRVREPGRRLIFVAHSLGGIIIKEVLRRSELSEEERIRDIINSTGAIVFLGTPHKGSSEFASTADIVRRVAQAVLRVDTNAKILRSLGVDSPELELCRESFITQWRTRGFRVKTFQESKAVFGLNLGHLDEKVVPDISSSLDDPREHAETIQANHMEMTKFWGRDDPGYQKVGFELSRLAASRSNDETECKHALTFEDMETRELAIKPPIAETGNWLFDTDAYSTWIKRTNVDYNQGLLCLKGKPGSGKSTLMKEAARRAKENIYPRPVVAIFFFNAQGSELERSPLGLFRSLVFQIFQQDENFKAFLTTHYRNATDRGSIKWSPGVKELQGVLEAGLLELHQRVILFLDALDECDHKNIRDVTRYFSTLSDRAFKTGKMLDVCFSSRHYPPIFIPRCPEIAVEEGNSVDIAQYIDSNIPYGIMSKDTMVDRLRSLLLQKTSGVFLWIVLVVDMVLQDIECGKVEEEIEETLKSVPDDLVALFKDLLSTLTVKEREGSEILVQWVLLSPRPLQAVDVRTIRLLGTETMNSHPEVKASLVKPGNLSTDWDKDADRVERNVRTLSRGLMEILDSRVRFIHESVRQFFLNEGSAVFGGPKFICSGHCMIIRACLHGLCLLENLASHGSSEIQIFHWIPVYVERFILHHAIQARHAVELPNRLHHLLRWVATVVASKSRLRDITHVSHTGAVAIVHELDVVEKSSMRQLISRPRLFDSHLVSLSGSGITLCNHILQQMKGPLNSAQTSAKRIALPFLEPDSRWWDEENKDFSGLESLRVNTEDRCASPSTQIVQPWEWQKIADLKQMLRNGVNVSMADSEGNTALHLAAWQGLPNVVETLLQCGALVDACNEYGMTPLHLACLYGHSEIVTRLIHLGADFDFPGSHGYTPLHVVAEGSNWTLTVHLLVAGANFTAVNDFGKTPLHLAVQYGAGIDVVRALRRYGADIRVRDQASLSPLDYAFELDRFLSDQNPRNFWSGSSTNFEKMLASRIGHRESHRFSTAGSFAPPPLKDMDN